MRSSSLTSWLTLQESRITGFFFVWCFVFVGLCIRSALRGGLHIEAFVSSGLEALFGFGAQGVQGLASRFFEGFRASKVLGFGLQAAASSSALTFEPTSTTAVA